MAVSALSPRRSGWKINEEFDLTVKSVDSYNSSFELLVKDLIQYKSQGYRIALLSGSRTRAERLAKDLSEEGLNAFTARTWIVSSVPGRSWWSMVTQDVASSIR